MAEQEPKDLLAEIEKALNSEKVDGFILFQFLNLRDYQPEFDPTKDEVAFLARVKDPSLPIVGAISQIDKIFAVVVPYSSMPGIVEDPNVVFLEASRETSSDNWD